MPGLIIMKPSCRMQRDRDKHEVKCMAGLPCLLATSADAVKFNL